MIFACMNTKAEAMMTLNFEHARLIPIVGTGSGKEKEQRATSALLAVLQIVRPLSKSLLSHYGAPRSSRATVECFIEPIFTLTSGAKVRPDGLIQIQSGKKDQFTALVEVKTGSAKLDVDQINSYVEIARNEDFDCVLTISNEIAPQPGIHPTAGINVRSNSKVKVFHLSWTSILATAVMEKVHRGIEDPEQAWILGELVRYLEHPLSGALGFDDMGINWTHVREGARDHTLRKRDPEVVDVAQRWDQLIRFISLRLGSEIGTDVQEVIPQRHRQDPIIRTRDFVDSLTNDGIISGQLKVPNTVNNMNITADLRARQLIVETQIDAPITMKSKGSTNWLLRQLRKSPDELTITSYPRKSSFGTNALLSQIREDPSVILLDSKREISRFKISRRTDMGLGRRAGKDSSFVDSVFESVRVFYGEVLQELQAFQPKAPRLKHTDSNVVEREINPITTSSLDIDNTNYHHYSPISAEESKPNQ